MQNSAGMHLLTTSEAADYLRLKERKLYELVAEGAIPCTKVTGKWLFPRADLDRWLLSGMARPLGLVPAQPPPIVGGSHDPLLQWALSESRAGLAILPEGSKRGYRRFLAGEVIAAAIHFLALDRPEGGANVEMVSQEPTLYDAVLLSFARRQQGLVVAAGNPLRLRSLGDAARTRARLAARPVGAGAQQLLEGLLLRETVAASDLVTALTAQGDSIHRMAWRREQDSEGLRGERGGFHDRRHAVAGTGGHVGPQDPEGSALSARLDHRHHALRHAVGRQ